MSGLEVKICGLTNAEDAAAALELGADYLGFVLYPESPRGITAETLADIVAGLPAGAKPIGVFVNAQLLLGPSFYLGGDLGFRGAKGDVEWDEFDSSGTQELDFSGGYVLGTVGLRF